MPLNIDMYLKFSGVLVMKDLNVSIGRYMIAANIRSSDGAGLSKRSFDLFNKDNTTLHSIFLSGPASLPLFPAKKHM